MTAIQQSFDKLEKYLIDEEYKGYDPYDTLLSWVPFKWLGKWGPVLGIQFQKRNPVNIRPLLGIKKEINPKAFGLFLQAYSALYSKTGNQEYLDKATHFFKWLRDNFSEGYSGKCWGYNFPWASPAKYMDPFVPSAVVTGFVVKGLYEYYLITKSVEVLEMMESACVFLNTDLEKFEDESGISISYTPLEKDVCYNASLLAAESFAKVSTLNGNQAYRDLATKCVDFVLKRQVKDGRWNYSVNLENGVERSQIDFHQGYVLESIYNIKKALNIEEPKWEEAISAGLKFYRSEQFHESGRSYWRIPRLYPVEIHNQSQGIITFDLMKEYDPSYSNFANKIADWTIGSMQADKGYFHYQKFRTHTHGIPYMRWSQAWMFLALSKLVNEQD